MPCPVCLQPLNQKVKTENGDNYYLECQNVNLHSEEKCRHIEVVRKGDLSKQDIQWDL